jgi:hypothetical protein
MLWLEREIDLLDAEVLEMPDRMTGDELHSEEGPGWRRRGGAAWDPEDDR